MNMKELRKKNIKELNYLLINLLHERFNLNLQYTSKKLKQTHLLKQVRRDIAQVKTLLTEKKQNCE